MITMKVTANNETSKLSNTKTLLSVVAVGIIDMPDTP